MWREVEREGEENLMDEAKRCLYCIDNYKNNTCKKYLDRGFVDSILQLEPIQSSQ